MTAGSLAALHGDTIALGRAARGAAHAGVGDRVTIMLGDGTRAHATVVAIYTRELGFGDALLAPELAAGHQTARCSGRSSSGPATRPPSPGGCGRCDAVPGLQVNDRASLDTRDDADRETNRWLGPLFVAIIFAFTSIAVVNTLAMIALRRGRELALLRLIGATAQVRSMARWEAALIVTIGLGRRPGDRRHGAVPAQPRADRQPPPIRPARSARGDPRRLGAAGAGRPRGADAAGAAHAAGRGHRDGGVNAQPPAASTRSIS